MIVTYDRENIFVVQVADWRHDTQHNIQHNDTQHKVVFCVTVSVSDSQHNNALPLCWASRFIYHYDECRVLFAIMLSVIMWNVVMLSVVAPKDLPVF